MFTVTISLKTGKIISAVDNGPRPGDDAYIPVMAGLIAKDIIREGGAAMKSYESLTLTVVMSAWVVVAFALIWQRHTMAAMGLQ